MFPIICCSVDKASGYKVDVELTNINGLCSEMLSQVNEMLC